MKPYSNGLETRQRPKDKFSKGDMVQIWNFVHNGFKSYGIVLERVLKPKRAPTQFYSVYNQSTKRIRTYPSGSITLVNETSRDHKNEI